MYILGKYILQIKCAYTMYIPTCFHICCNVPANLTWPARPSSVYLTSVLYKPTVASRNKDRPVASKAYAWLLLGMMPALSK